MILLEPTPGEAAQARMDELRGQTARMRRQVRSLNVILSVILGATLFFWGLTAYRAVSNGLPQAGVSLAYTWLGTSIVLTMVTLLQQAALRIAHQQVQGYDHSYQMANQMLRETLLSLDEMITARRADRQERDDTI